MLVQETLHRALRAHGHEHRCLDGTVRGVKDTAARLTVDVRDMKREVHRT